MKLEEEKEEEGEEAAVARGISLYQALLGSTVNLPFWNGTEFSVEPISLPFAS